MSLAAIVATTVLALMLSFVAMVLYATMRQVSGEARAAAEERDR